MVNREETIAWVNTLKPGDKVIHFVQNSWNHEPDNILIVQKVTPTGIVRTEDGSYRVSKYSSRCWGQGDSSGYIAPYNEDDASAAMRHIAEVAEARRKERLIYDAKAVCYDLRYGKIQMTVEMAEVILGLVQNKKEEPVC